ncbi:DEAD/DEAH box helicase [Candidatus Woesearchaeota archaeon]|nr:DEAD/DEAH box helicase [Candidatus Woesearchaeota archaeon]
MLLKDIKKYLPKEFYEILNKDINKLRPSQEKAIKKGLFKGKNLLVCTPTASGKTLIAEMAMLKQLLEKGGKAIYVVPLKALASEKYKDFKKKYGGLIKVALSIGDLDSSDTGLYKHDLILTTSEKMDSLIRHKSRWIEDIKVIVVDEIHLLNDPGRGPTLEILLTILKQMLNAQIIGLSATIGNPQELADWMDAELVIDLWRPVKLRKGIYYGKKIEYEDEEK